jgi:hypothetical protein
MRNLRYKVGFWVSDLLFDFGLFNASQVVFDWACHKYGSNK